MELLRTPTERFSNIIDFSYKPKYIEVDNVRIAYIDEGTNDQDVVLLMHGEPSWSYLYRHMIPLLLKNGFRIVVPDLVGFGRSDKPASPSDHSYFQHVQWMTNWLLKIALTNITIFCQDWGSLIGLRLVCGHEKRFKRIILSNGGLPTGAERLSSAFQQWQEFSKTSSDFDIGDIIQRGTNKELSEEILNAYRSPFPDDSYKVGPRIMPSLVPTSIEDPEHVRNSQAFENFKKWYKPFLTIFSDNDPITAGGDRIWQKIVPGAKNQNHVIVKDAGHFIQEDKGLECAKIIITFIEENPL